MTKRSVIRIDNNLNQVFSVRLKTGAGEYENGFVGKLGDYEENNLDVQALELATAGDSIVVVANSAIVYDNARLGKGLETEYFMAEGEVIRAYVPEAGKALSISLEGFKVEPAKGDIIVPDGKQLTVAETAPTTGTYFEVVKIEKVGGALALNVTNNATTYAVLKTKQV
ncbi:hypothetical protein M3649_04150 [Ureibacillus chungkukjangi]|uniref:hypothetical protein n=1 Tax=Ureibacillus chungkukjangi TaxID=1202712 RepID=UPI0020416C66|nr:hypothetical protein [Ureibacillus chungkukjangi]MCM3387325.1 hypothetical protein [Ureibacillus chungkukjangi]